MEGRTVSKTIHRQLSIDNIPTHWARLLGLHPLCPVHDEADRDSLSTLLSASESERHPVRTRKFSGLDMLRSLIEDHAMSAADLGRLLGVHRSHAAKITRGERSLPVDHLRTLFGHFRVRPDLFID